MSEPEPSSGAEVARSVCLTQALIGGLAVGVAAIVWGRLQAVAALYGGLVAIVPTIYFAMRVFLRRGNAGPAEVVGAIFRGEMGKLALTAVMFGIGAKLFGGQFLALLSAYAACSMAYWIVIARTGLRQH